MAARGSAGLILGGMLLLGQGAGAQSTGEVAKPPAYVRTLSQAQVYRTPSTTTQIGFVHMGARCRVLKAVRVGNAIWYQVRWEQGGVSFARAYAGAGSGSGYILSSATDRPDLPDAPPAKAGAAQLASTKPDPKDREKPFEKALTLSYIRPTASFGAEYKVVEEKYDPDARRYRWVLESTEAKSDVPAFTGEFQDDAGEAVRKISLRFDPASGYTEKGKRMRVSLPYPSEVTLARVRRILVTKTPR